MSTDWRTMEAGRELDRVVAERVGYTEIEETTGWFDDPDVGSREETYLRGRGADGRYSSERIPNYSTSVDAALLLPFDGLKGGWDGGNSLVIELSTAVQVRYMMTAAVHTPHAPTISYGGDSDFEKPYTERLALAICRAWLAWQESKGGDE